MPGVNIDESKKNASKGLTVIICECGAEILMVPDAKIMGNAIESHVEWHKQKVVDPATADVEAESIRDCLIAQAMHKANDSTK